MLGNGPKVGLSQTEQPNVPLIEVVHLSRLDGAFDSPGYHPQESPCVPGQNEQYRHPQGFACIPPGQPASPSCSGWFSCPQNSELAKRRQLSASFERKRSFNYRFWAETKQFTPIYSLAIWFGELAVILPAAYLWCGKYFKYSVLTVPSRVEGRWNLPMNATPHWVQQSVHRRPSRVDLCTPVSVLEAARPPCGDTRGLITSGFQAGEVRG